MAIDKLRSRNVVLILIFGVGIILFVLLSIFPNYIAYSNINQEISRLKGQIDEQKILSPIFNDLSEKAKFEEPADLPFPKPAKLAKNETGKISSIIKSIVNNNGFKIDHIATDVDSLAQEPNRLKLSVHMSGDFMNLRNVLLQLGALPFLEHVESIQVSSHQSKSKIQLKLWFAQQ